MITTEIKFGVGQAELFVRARLPLPQERLLEAQDCGGRSHQSALARVEALLPLVLSELLYGRSGSQASVSQPATEVIETVE